MKVLSKASQLPTKAYGCGWIDGRYAKLGLFTENHRLSEWERESERLDYYGGHRAGREARRRREGLA